MNDPAGKLTEALSDRYTIEEELGAERFLSEIKTTANLQHPHIRGPVVGGEPARSLR